VSEFVTNTSTEQAYVQWVRTFVKWHGLRHPRDMGHVEIERFLGMLANERRVAASTHNQALSALLFLYREVLGIDLPWLDAVRRPRAPRRIGLAHAAWLNDSFGAFIWMAAQGRQRQLADGGSGRSAPSPEQRWHPFMKLWMKEPSLTKAVSRRGIQRAAGFDGCRHSSLKFNRLPPA